MALIRRSSVAFPRQWNPTQLPNFPVEVDTTHPLSRGLTTLFLPGKSPNDLCNAAQPLSFGPTGVPASSPFGQGFYQADYLQTQTPSALLAASASSISMFIAGVILAAPTQYPRLIGIRYTNNGNTAPYDVVSSQLAPGSSPFNPGLSWNSGGTQNTQTSSGAIYQNTAFTAAVTYAVGGSINLYVGPALASSVAFGTTAPTYAANSLLVMGCDCSVPFTGGYVPTTTAIGAWWGRQLSANEVAWLNAEPFVMLRPIMRRQYYAPAAAASGLITGTASASATAIATLTGAVALSGTAAAATTAAGTLTGKGALTGTATGVTAAAGTLTGTGALSATAAVAATTTGALTNNTAGSASGTSAIAAAATGTLTGAGAVSGTAAVGVAAAGTLTASGQLAATPAVVTTATGTLTGAGALSGTAAAATIATGTLTGAGAIVGTAAGAAAASGTLAAAAAGAVAGTAAVVSSASGVLTGGGALAGGSVATAIAAGTLTGFGNISGIATATATATGVLTASNAPPFVRSTARTAIGTAASRAIVGTGPSRAIVGTGPSRHL